MEVINYELKYKIDDLVVAIGYFDGMHLAHQELLEKTLRVAKQKQLKSAVLSFSTSPKSVLNEEDYPQLMSFEDKLRFCETMNFDYFVVVDVTMQFCNLSAQDFLSSLHTFGCKYLICGYDFRFGLNREGNIDTISNSTLFESYIVAKIGGQEKISSSQICSFIRAGKIMEANIALGYEYQMRGKVVPGKQIGRTISFPTANISLDYNYVLPKEGVYIGSFIVNKESYRCLINIGTNPTVKGKYRTIEAFIDDFSGNIYHQAVIIKWIKFIRKEIKFANKEELRQQISRDLEVLRTTEM